MALLNYPILMSADILVYKASLVPVGIDQEPHLEISREIARKMNEAYGLDFPEPQRFATKGEYVPSLRGEGKMSKSVEGSFINLTDDYSTILKRLSAMPTNSGNGKIEKFLEKGNSFNLKPSIRPDGKPLKQDRDFNIYFDENGNESIGVKNLFKMVELIQGEDKRTEYELMYETSGVRFGDLKKELAQAIYTGLKPIQEKRAELEADPEYVDSVIETGAARARAIATEVVLEVRKAMGLG